MNIQKMISNIQIYINHMKNVEVNISPRMPIDLHKLIMANEIASQWIANNLVPLKK